jgi:SagB-type dehydrogenase family enzyme
MKRRGFFAKLAVVGTGAYVAMKGVKAWAKELPSSPSAKRKSGNEEEIILPAFEKDINVTIDRALLDRKTSRDFDGEKTLTREQISRLLWATTGVNRPDGHHTTVPSAMAKYPVSVYVALPDGAFIYDPYKHSLVKFKDEDIRKKIPIQKPHRSAAMTLVFVSDKSKVSAGDHRWADYEIGCMVQNLYLMAAAMGLGSCVFGLVRFDKAPRLLNLEKNKSVRLGHAVGPLIG